jgi:cell division protein FtsN
MKSTAAAPSKESSKGTKSTATKEVVAPSAAKKGYALAIGDTATAGEAEKLRGRLNKLGITNVTVKTIRKTETMHRLSLGEFSDSSAAGAELGRLKPFASGAFILKENGRYALYAGSYIHAARAESEAKRLSAKGFKAEIKDAQVGVQVHQVMAGSFAGNDEATKAAEKLKKNGISAEVVRLGQ